MRALPWSTCPIDACEIPARKIHHHSWGLYKLNKGELLHVLRSWLWFGGDSVLRQKQEEAQQEVVRCLDVVTNVVVV